MRQLQFLASVLCCLAASAAHGNPVFGEWATQGYAARVQIRGCDHARDRLCGIIVWLWEPSDKQGRPMVDMRNPDAGRRGTPLVGLQMLADFAPAARPQSWAGGTIYNPEDGRTYAANLTLRAPDLLEVEGCVLILCSRQVWRKLPPSCHPELSDATHRRP